MRNLLIQMILKNGIIKTNFKEPVTFKSGIKSPIYCNFRECSSHPELMELICVNFQQLLYGEEIDGVIGVATGGVPHSTLLASKMNLPSGYIRPDAKAKDYGLKKLIEGIEVAGKSIIIIEDLITTGDSVINNALIVKKAGASKICIKSIFSYDTEISKKEFAQAGFIPESLITIHDVLPHFKETLSVEEYESLLDWVRDPEGWFNRHKLEFDFGFLTRLRQSATDSGSIISFGLDPVIESLPEEYVKYGIQGFYLFMKDLFSEMKKRGISPGMFKPNLAWWQVHDEPWDHEYKGTNSLTNIMSLIKNNFPSSIPINIDFKKGDIGTSSTKWAIYGYEKLRADAVTCHTYMGSDSVGPFDSYCNKDKGKGAYLLVKTTNKGASDLELKKMADGRLVYEQVADNVINWAKGNPGVCAVVAGNSPEQLSVLGKMFAGKDIGLLIPGVGPSQGGDAGQVAQILSESSFELGLARINLSSGLTHPWYKEGTPNPTTKECIEIIINTLVDLNNKVGFIS